MEGDKAPAVYKARNKAMELVGNEMLLDESLKVEANRRIKSHVEEMKKLEYGFADSRHRQGCHSRRSQERRGMVRDF